MLGSIWETFCEAFNLGGLFDIIKTIFYAVLIIAAIVIVVFVSICIIGYVMDEKKKKKAEEKYIDALEAKYSKWSKRELAEIYDELVGYRKSINSAKEAKKKPKYEMSKDDLITQLAVGILRDAIRDKYQILVDEEYIHHDMEYLKKRL